MNPDAEFKKGGYQSYVSAISSVQIGHIDDALRSAALALVMLRHIKDEAGISYCNLLIEGLQMDDDKVYGAMQYANQKLT